MSPFLAATFRFRDFERCSAACVLALILVLSPFFALAQSPGQAGSASLQGSVHDARRHPLPGASVYLQAGNAAKSLIAHTDAQGTFRCSSLRPGTYILRVEMAGYGEATSGPFRLGQKEAKKLDLTLRPPKASDLKSAGAPEFFDQPLFTIAGVTDTTNLGGHGSGATLRNSEALTKATVTLSKESPARAHSGSSATEESLRATLQHNPEDFDANHRLGNFLLDNGKAEQSLLFLEKASHLNSGDYENSYELALAYAETGRYQEARTQARDLLARQDKVQDKPEVHHLLADVEEKLGNPVEAVRRYQRAAELNPSEPYLFDWGSELLLHRAVEPAMEVFNKGNRLFPRSTRMLIGLGVAWYARGAYDDATQRLCDASDRNPNDPTPYIFLGKMQSAGSNPSDPAVADHLEDRLSRFLKLHPENADANYYYAITLIKRRKGPNDAGNFAQAESLLQKAVHLDPRLGPAHLQIGILHAEREDFPNAIAAYQKAIQVAPELEEVHYRLAQAYRRTGETTKAHEEIKLYDQLSKKTAEELERRRHEIPQFVYTLRGQTPAWPPQ